MNQYYFLEKHRIFTLNHKGKNQKLFSEKSNRVTEGKNIGHFDALSILKSFANSSQITFEVTQSCNLKCRYCAFGELYINYEPRRDKCLSFQKAKILLDYYIELRKSSIYESYNRPIYIGFYGGEPLLNFKLVTQIVRYVEDKIPCTFGMTTNGILLSKYMDYLHEKNFSLLISLDGDEHNNCYRVNKNNTSSFRKVYDNVKRLKKNYPEYFLKKIMFNSVLHNQNSVESIHNFFKKEFNKIPRISPVSYVGISEYQKQNYQKIYQDFAGSLEKAINKSQIIKDLEVAAPDSESLTKFLYSYSDNFYKSYNDFFYHKPKRMPTGTCLPFSRKIFVLANGNLLPCERIGQNWKYGWVSEDKVEIDFNKIANKHNEFYEKMNKSCSKCSLIETCEKCMLHIEGIENDPICDSFFENPNYIGNYFAAQFSILESKPYLYSDIIEKVTVE